jgi:hypothetical protein
MRKRGNGWFSLSAHHSLSWIFKMISWPIHLLFSFSWIQKGYFKNMWNFQGILGEWRKKGQGISSPQAMNLWPTSKYQLWPKNSGVPHAWHWVSMKIRVKSGMYRLWHIRNLELHNKWKNRRSETNLFPSLKQKTARRNSYFYFLTIFRPNEKTRKTTSSMDGEKV